MPDQIPPGNPWAHDEYADGAVSHRRVSDIRLDLWCRRTPLGRFVLDVVRPNDSVLEVGYGGGAFYRWLKYRLPVRYKGIDISSEAIRKYLKDEDELRAFVEGDFMDHLPDPGSYDVVYCDNVAPYFQDPWKGIEHLYAASRRHLLLGLKVVLAGDDVVGKQTFTGAIPLSIWVPNLWKLVGFLVDQDAWRCVKVRLRKWVYNPALSLPDHIFSSDLAASCDILVDKVSEVPFARRLDIQTRDEVSSIKRLMRSASAMWRKMGAQ